MKKIVILLVMALPVFVACQKEEKLEAKMEGHSGDSSDDYGLNEKELAEIAIIKNELIAEIKRGDSITVADLKSDIDSLKQEIHKLRSKK